VTYDNPSFPTTRTSSLMRVLQRRSFRPRAEPHRRTRRFELRVEDVSLQARIGCGYSRCRRSQLGAKDIRGLSDCNSFVDRDEPVEALTTEATVRRKRDIGRVKVG